MPDTTTNGLYLPKEGERIIRQQYNDNFETLDPLLGSSAMHVHVYNHIPAESANGSNTNFSTSGTDIFLTGTIRVFVNRMICLTSEYSEDGDKQGITFNTAPTNGSEICMHYDKTLAPP